MIIIINHIAVHDHPQDRVIASVDLFEVAVLIKYEYEVWRMDSCQQNFRLSMENVQQFLL